MLPLLPLLLLLTIAHGQSVSASGGGTDCADWHDCRQRALDAAAAHDYEIFHDLAWRAVQKGPRQDASLMQLLARAQSLSGRPHDALVMLLRLADRGIVTDAPDSDEFAAVRRLPQWPEGEARLRGGPLGGAGGAARDGGGSGGGGRPPKGPGAGAGRRGPPGGPEIPPAATPPPPPRARRDAGGQAAGFRGQKEGDATPAAAAIAPATSAV